MKIFIFFVLMLSKAHSYEIYRSGNMSDIKISPTFLACLAGGGDDDLWAGGWRRLLRSANGGDVVIIRADGDRGGYEDWILQDTSHLRFPKVNSVSTIVLNNKSDANNRAIVDTINKAELVFFAGGDQSRYIDLLKGTEVLKIIQKRLDNLNLSVAGTSAGMAILGEYDYGAHYSSPSDNESNVTSADVLKDFMEKFVDVKKGFLSAPFLNNVITDTHFSSRNRQGRLLGFMAKAFFLENNYINGIGSDEGTAFCYDQSGIGTVYGEGAVYFFKPEMPPSVNPNRSLRWSKVRAYILKNGRKFNLLNWETNAPDFEYWSVK